MVVVGDVFGVEDEMTGVAEPTERGPERETRMLLMLPLFKDKFAEEEDGEGDGEDGARLDRFDTSMLFVGGDDGDGADAMDDGELMGGDADDCGGDVERSALPPAACVRIIDGLVALALEDGDEILSGVPGRNGLKTEFAPEPDGRR